MTSSLVRAVAEEDVDLLEVLALRAVVDVDRETLHAVEGAGGRGHGGLRALVGIGGGEVGAVWVVARVVAASFAVVWLLVVENFNHRLFLGRVAAVMVTLAHCGKI